MIVSMSRVRILGPQDDLPRILRELQDLGLLHLAPPPDGGLAPAGQTPSEERERRHLQRILEDVERALTGLGAARASPASGRPGRLPDRAPHRSGRADFPHPAP